MKNQPQLKNTINEKLAYWNKRLIDEVVSNGDSDHELNSTLLKIVQDLDEVKAICEKRGRY